MRMNRYKLIDFVTTIKACENKQRQACNLKLMQTMKSGSQISRHVGAELDDEGC